MMDYLYANFYFINNFYYYELFSLISNFCKDMEVALLIVYTVC